MRDELTPADIAQLQGAILTAALTGTPLPGGAAVTIPELATAARAEERVVLLQDNLNLDALQRITTPIVVASKPEIAQLAASGTDVLFLCFRPLQRHGDAIALVLDVGLQQAFGSLPLGGVMVEFEDTGDGWTTTSPPAAFAV